MHDIFIDFDSPFFKSKVIKDCLVKMSCKLTDLKSIMENFFLKLSKLINSTYKEG